MHLPKPLLMAVVLTAVALAGCSEGGDDGGPHGFTIVSEPSDPVTEPYVFRATVSADTYQWDLGDGTPVQEGREVEYVYGFADGTVKPKLTTIAGGERTTYPPRTLVLGTGQNTVPDLVMAVSWNWVTVGEPITFSGALSEDADGDALLYSWFCVRQSGIGPAGAGHAHAGAGGITYGASGPDPVPVQLLNGTDVPTADTDHGGGICAKMGSGGFSRDATITGSFDEPGIYKITMLGKDPKTPSIPGSTLVYVTAPDQPRIEGPVTIPFEGSMQFGVPQQLDAAMAQAGQQGEYIHDVPFKVQYPVNGVQLDFDFEAGATGLNQVTYLIIKPNGNAKTTGEQTEGVSGDAGYLEESSSPHVLRVFGRAGTDLAYSGTITLDYVLDPNLLFEDPAGH